MALSNRNRARAKLALEIMEEIHRVAVSLPSSSRKDYHRRVDHMVAIYCALEVGGSVLPPDAG